MSLIRLMVLEAHTQSQQWSNIFIERKMEVYLLVFVTEKKGKTERFELGLQKVLDLFLNNFLFQKDAPERYLFQ